MITHPLVPHGDIKQWTPMSGATGMPIIQYVLILLEFVYGNDVCSPLPLPNTCDIQINPPHCWRSKLFPSKRMDTCSSMGMGLGSNFTPNKLLFIFGEIWWALEEMPDIFPNLPSPLIWNVWHYLECFYHTQFWRESMPTEQWAPPPVQDFAWCLVCFGWFCDMSYPIMGLGR